MKDFTIIERTSGERIPMIGTITGVYNSQTSINGFKKRFIQAVSEHFDIADFNHDELPNLFDGEIKWEVEIEAEGINYPLVIMETWLY